ncbi:hypothetical protein ACJJTC_008314 [Scirpophaga incertulas]
MEVDSVHSIVERKLKMLASFFLLSMPQLQNKPRNILLHTRFFNQITPFLKITLQCKKYQIYDSIRPGRSAGDDCVVDLRVLKYNPNGTIEFKKHFKDDFSPLPWRPKPISAVVNNVPPLYSSRLPILDTKK